VTLASGVRLPYVEHGDRAGVPVLLLHGVTDSWRSFESVLPHLPSSMRAFAITQRGHGDADRPERYRPLDFAGDIVAFADALGLGQVVLVGHSMGGTNAQRTAIAFPDRLLGLVLVASFATYHRPELDEFWTSTIAPLTDPIDPAVARGFQESTLARPIPPAFLETAIAESLKVPARVWRGAFQGFMEDDFASERGKIRTPTLLIWGDQDSFVPREDQDALLTAIKGAHLVVYEGAGHALHWEEPARFAADVAAFVAGLARG
jgi:pimeloyl-ACP methyl ester carboxylesterase